MAAFGVIGDIHGMLDPLKALLTSIFDLEPQEIEEQSRPMKFEEYHRFWMSKNLDISDTSIWTRRIYDRKTDNYILVHGHTPTIYLHHQFDTNLSPEEIFFNIAPKAKNDSRSTIDRLISIGLDTGAVYGYALTAMYISKKALENCEIISLSILTSKGFRDNSPRLKRIKI